MTTVVNTGALCQEAGVVQETSLALVLFVLGYVVFLPRWRLLERITWLVPCGSEAHLASWSALCKRPPGHLQSAGGRSVPAVGKL
mmetsp:Transcript_73348/g.166262  ORF Transcript_73348/g.166262 Transcript_73348/m.166262 type:complete len:85 (-) Transcript_73348:61-315(-)